MNHWSFFPEDRVRIPALQYVMYCSAGMRPILSPLFLSDPFMPRMKTSLAHLSLATYKKRGSFRLHPGHLNVLDAGPLEPLVDEH